MENIFKTILHLFLAMFLSLGLAQCSTDDGDKVEEVVENDQQEDDMQEGDESDQQEEDEDSYEEEDQEAESVEGDSDEEAYGTADEDVLGNMQNEGEADDAAAYGSEVVEAEPVMPVDEVADTQPVAMPTASSEPVPNDSNWRVYYVKDATVTAYRGQTEAAGQFSKGESLLMKVEGGWAMLQDGRQINASSITTNPVSRIRRAGAWR